MKSNTYNVKIYDRNNTMINPGDILAWKPESTIKYTAAINGNGEMEAVAIGSLARSLPKFSSEMMKLMVVLEKGSGGENVHIHIHR